MERKNRLYLIRHGQVVDHEKFQANGHTDVDITDVGREQMESLADRLRFINISKIYSSDLRRAETGARIIAKYHNVKCESQPELREIYFGDWEGVSFFNIQKDSPELVAAINESLQSMMDAGEIDAFITAATELQSAE